MAVVANSITLIANVVVDQSNYSGIQAGINHIFDGFPLELQKVVTPVLNKRLDVSSSSTTENVIWIPSIDEINGGYSIFSDNASRIRHMSGNNLTTSSYWLRPLTAEQQGSPSIVNTSGEVVVSNQNINGLLVGIVVSGSIRQDLPVNTWANAANNIKLSTLITGNAPSSASLRDTVIIPNKYFGNIEFMVAGINVDTVDEKYLKNQDTVYVSAHKGDVMRQSIHRVLNTDIEGYAWLTLIGTSEQAIELNTLTDLGNFKVSNYIHGPVCEDGHPVQNQPIAIINKMLQNVLVQISLVGSEVYSRAHDGTQYGEWAYGSTINPSSVIYKGSIPPVNPIPDKTFWVKDLGAGNGYQLMVFHVIDSVPTWIPVGPRNYLTSDIYDTENVKTSISDYLTEKIVPVQDMVTGIMSHTNDASIHITAEDRTTFNDKLSTSDLTSKLTTFKTDAKKYADDTIAADVPLTTLTDDIDAIEAKRKTHQGIGADGTVSLENSHPTAEQVADWESKATGDHGHDVSTDGHKVKIAGEDIISGLIPVDRLPEAVFNRIITVASDAARFALTADRCRNGTVVHVLDTANNVDMWYRVFDVTKLNTEEGYRCFSFPTALSVPFSGILNRPTTLAGYSLDDEIYKKTEFDTKAATIVSDAKTDTDTKITTLNKVSIDGTDKTIAEAFTLNKTEMVRIDGEIDTLMAVNPSGEAGKDIHDAISGISTSLYSTDMIAKDAAVIKDINSRL